MDLWYLIAFRCSTFPHFEVAPCYKCFECVSALLWSRPQRDAIIPVVNENEAIQTAAVALPSQDFTQGTKLHRDCLKAETIPKLQKEHYLFEKGKKKNEKS